MKEEFISFLWKSRLIRPAGLCSTDGEPLEIIYPGQENLDAGPDFLAARIKVGQIQWVGNVEIHVKSSDWLHHNHQNNRQYDNVILHVVHNNDIEVNDTLEKGIKVLEVKTRYDASLLENYERLMTSKTWIPCQNQVGGVDVMVLQGWLARLMVERLEGKSDEVEGYLNFFKNDWEQTLFYFLARNLGFKVNSSPFGILAQRTPYLLLQKNSDDLQKLEAILFGQAGLLSDKNKDVYARVLFSEYNYQKSKYNLVPIEKSSWKFSKLRPVNFPTMRISQLAAILHGSKHLFRTMVEANNVNDIHDMFSARASDFWETHYIFEKSSPKKVKNLGRQSIDNIIINTIAPILFVYGRQTNNEKLCDKALNLLHETPSEENSIIEKWKSIGVAAQNAGESQALIELKKFYCTPKNCLKCAIGIHLLRS